jgi:hypothetical protein
MDKKTVFVIGDSISIHYGPFLKKMVNEKYNYDRKGNMEDALKNLDKAIGANGGDSSMVLEYLNSHDEIVNRDARNITGIKSENTMKRVFLRLKDQGMLEPVPGKKGSASAWRLIKK